MHRLINISLAVHWAVIFALMAAGTARGASSPELLVTGLCAGFALIAILFTWSALAHGVEDGTGALEVADIAYASAALMLTIAAVVVFAAGGEAVLSLTGIQIAGLAASSLVARANVDGKAGSGSVDQSHLVARRLAVGAAHGSMLTRISGRPMQEGDS